MIIPHQVKTLPHNFTNLSLFKDSMVTFPTHLVVVTHLDEVVLEEDEAEIIILYVNYAIGLAM